MVGKLTKLMREHLDDEMTVVQMADSCCLSPYHFQRVFTKVAGEGCARMYRRLRLERAAWQLQNTSMSVSDIACAAGFVGPEPFARSFKMAYACSAGQFRQAEWTGYTMFAPNRVHFSPDGGGEFAPMERHGCGIPFRIEAVERFSVMGRRHMGPPGLMHKTWSAFIEEMTGRGYDVRRHPLVGFSPGLRRYLPAGKVRNHVAVMFDPSMAADLVVQELGGCTCVVSEHVGSGNSLGDFWMRMWAEVMPAARMRQSKGVPFQLVTASGEPGVFCARLHIPVLTNSAFFA